MRKTSMFAFLSLVVCLAVGLSGVASPQKKGKGGGGKSPETPMKVEILSPLSVGSGDAVVMNDPGCYGVTGVTDEGRVGPLSFRHGLQAFDLGSFTAECLWVQVARRRADNAVTGVTLNFRAGECHPSDLSVATDFVEVSGGGVVFASPTQEFQIPIEAQDVNVPERNPFGQISIGTFRVSPCSAGEDCSQPSCP